MNEHGIHSLPITATPLAVVDVETTGLHPSGDRIIELGIVRLEPGEKPELVLDTLINPDRPVTATEIHGIDDADVVDAPSFREVAPHVLSSLEGCVLAAFNVYFDAKFLRAELTRAGIKLFPPYLCLMYMRSLLGLGGRCTLNDACVEHGIEVERQHVAADDALHGAALWLGYQQAMDDLGIATFADLVKRKKYKFTTTFDRDILAPRRQHVSATAFKSRRARPVRESFERARVDLRREYWEALKAAVADLELAETEIAYFAASWGRSA